MALVIIHIQDTHGGQGVAVHAYGEPELSTLANADPATFTLAQRVGAAALAAISADLDDVREAQAQVEVATPSIIVPGRGRH